MKRPNVRHAAMMRLIDDAMRGAGYLPTDGGNGAVVYWPPRPLTEPVRIVVTAADLMHTNPVEMAQRIIDYAMGPDPTAACAPIKPVPMGGQHALTADRANGIKITPTRMDAERDHLAMRLGGRAQ